MPIPGDDVRDIVFVGQITESKGPHLLIEAFRSIAEAHAQARLLIVGRISDWSGDKWARDLRDSVAHDPALRSRVIFLGFVENVSDLLEVERCSLPRHCLKNLWAWWLWKPKQQPFRRSCFQAADFLK